MEIELANSYSLWLGVSIVRMPDPGQQIVPHDENNIPVKRMDAKFNHMVSCVLAQFPFYGNKIILS